MCSKKVLDHDDKFLSQLFRFLLNLGDKFYHDSRKSPQLTVEVVFSQEEANQIGYIVIQMINTEYKVDIVNQASQFNKDCCDVRHIYEIPCRHYFAHRIQLQLEQQSKEQFHFLMPLLHLKEILLK